MTLVMLLVSTLAAGQAATDVLSSWKDGAAKAAIMAFVQRVTRPGTPRFVPEAERIANFDNDGTPWSAQPLFFSVCLRSIRVRALAPEHPEWRKSKQYEAGVKQEWKGFGGTLSLFQVAKASGLLDPESNEYAVDGEQRHRGVEANVFGELAPGVRLLGGVAWIDAELMNTGVSAAIGNRPIGVPEVAA